MKTYTVQLWLDPTAPLSEITEWLRDNLVKIRINDHVIGEAKPHLMVRGFGCDIATESPKIRKEMSDKQWIPFTVQAPEGARLSIEIPIAPFRTEVQVQELTR